MADSEPPQSPLRVLRLFNDVNSALNRLKMSNDQLSTETCLPQHVSLMSYAEQETYRLNFLGQILGPVDKWLIANARSPRMGFLKDYLMLTNPKVEYVDCYVDLVCEVLPSTSGASDSTKIYTLYIVASVPPTAQAVLFLRQSPRAILDRFVGSREALNAPLWASWTKPSLKFQQPKSTFAALFIQMATWELNAKQVGLSFKMAQWARSITASVTATARSFRPVTPRKSQMTSPAQNRKRRASSDISTDSPSPSPSKLLASRALKRCQTFTEKD